MTLETKQKLLVMLGVVTTLSMGIPGSAYANHGVGSGAWNHDDVDYDCLGSLNDMTTEDGTDPCNDFATAVEVWNDISSSDLEFDEVSSNPDMTVGAESMGEGIWATNQ